VVDQSSRAAGDDPGAGQEQPQGQRGRHPHHRGTGAGDERAYEDVLLGVDVADEPGQQVAPAQAARRRGPQADEGLPDPDPQVGEHPQRHVVGGEPLEIAEGALQVRARVGARVLPAHGPHLRQAPRDRQHLVGRQPAPRRRHVSRGARARRSRQMRN